MIGLFFDTETTGVKSWRDPEFVPELVQLGAILQDLDTGRVLAEVNLINREVSNVPFGAAQVHGISTEMAAKYGIDRSLIDEIFAKMVEKADVVVAHNIKYDLDIVEDNMPMTQDYIKEKAIFCTMEASIYLVKSPLSGKQRMYFASHPEKQDAAYKVPNLTETYRHFFGVPFEGAHDAMADIRACRDIFLELQKAGYVVADDTGAVAMTSKLQQIIAAEWPKK